MPWYCACSAYKPIHPKPEVQWPKHTRTIHTLRVRQKSPEYKNTMTPTCGPACCRRMPGGAVVVPGGLKGRRSLAFTWSGQRPLSTAVPSVGRYVADRPRATKGFQQQKFRRRSRVYAAPINRPQAEGLGHRTSVDDQVTRRGRRGCPIDVENGRSSGATAAPLVVVPIRRSR
jgi:hypothetical protein